MIVFRIQAVVAEIMVGNSTGGPDILLMDNLARLVERRISSEPSAVAYQPGRPVEPVQFPGREPVVEAVTGSITGDGSASPGSVVASSAQGVEVKVNAYQDNVPPNNRAFQPQGRYMVVDWTITNLSATPLSVIRSDFKLQTAEGYLIDRALHINRQPDLSSYTLGPGQTVRGWLTYDVPSRARITAFIYQPAGQPQVVVATLP
jgi:hypothetical protein